MGMSKVFILRVEELYFILLLAIIRELVFIGINGFERRFNGLTLTFIFV